LSSKKADAPRPQPVLHRLRLYVAGSNVRSLRAVQNLKRVCEAELPGSYKLEVVDIYKNPRRAADDRIVAIPTLIKEAPGVVTRMIGDLSKTSIVRHGLGLGLQEST
jgi:circadian clock protein KaiB